ncbi:MAG: hypothetical protein KKC68_00590 [Candidatus Thermoplasmatota archaeon]|nr:hypothetical protein [Candidatus Thermoplasmatota archaeon]MBU1940249.1 hypothetical protein [Candidatus Thermoplasmatota archaeon]
MDKKLFSVVVILLMLILCIQTIQGNENLFSINLNEDQPMVSIGTLSDDIWGKIYGGSGDDFGGSVQETSDGGYIIGGTTESFSTDSQVWLIKTDADGNEQWNKSYGGSGVPYYGVRAIQTSDGGYAVTGWLELTSSADIGILIKTDSTGNMLWINYYSGSGAQLYEHLYAVKQTIDGGYIMTGHIFSYEDKNRFYWTDLWIVKADSSGIVQWTKTLGGYEYCPDCGYDVIQSSDGGYVIVGQSYQVGSEGAWMIKTDASGVLQWDYKSVTMRRARSVEETSDGGYIWVGVNWLCKMTNFGNVLWKQEYDLSVCDFNNDVIELSDGGFACVGGSKFFTTDSVGTLMYNGTFADCSLSEVLEANLGYGIIVGSTTAFGAVGSDVLLMKGPLDWVPPEAEIVSPLYGLYLGSIKLLPLNKLTVVIGSPILEVVATDGFSGMDRVEVFVEGVLEHTIPAEPYEWKWVEWIPGIYTISITAFDAIGNEMSDEIVVLNIF